MGDFRNYGRLQKHQNKAVLCQFPWIFGTRFQKERSGHLQFSKWNCIPVDRLEPPMLLHIVCSVLKVKCSN